MGRPGQAGPGRAQGIQLTGNHRRVPAASRPAAFEPGTPAVTNAVQPRPGARAGGGARAAQAGPGKGGQPRWGAAAGRRKLTLAEHLGGAQLCGQKVMSVLFSVSEMGLSPFKKGVK